MTNGRLARSHVALFGHRPIKASLFGGAGHPPRARRPERRSYRARCSRRRCGRRSRRRARRSRLLGRSARAFAPSRIDASRIPSRRRRRRVAFAYTAPGRRSPRPTGPASRTRTPRRRPMAAAATRGGTGNPAAALRAAAASRPDAAAAVAETAPRTSALAVAVAAAAEVSPPATSTSSPTARRRGVCSTSSSASRTTRARTPSRVDHARPPRRRVRVLGLPVGRTREDGRPLLCDGPGYGVRVVRKSCDARSVPPVFSYVLDVDDVAVNSATVATGSIKPLKIRVRPKVRAEVARLGRRRIRRRRRRSCGTRSDRRRRR